MIFNTHRFATLRLKPTFRFTTLRSLCSLQKRLEVIGNKKAGYLTTSSPGVP